MKDTCRIIFRIMIDLRVEIDDKGRAEGGEQTGLRTSEVRDAEQMDGAYENQHDVEVFIAGLGVVSVVFRCHLLVYRVERKTGVVVFVGYGGGPGRVSDTTFAQKPVTKARRNSQRTTLD